MKRGCFGSKQSTSATIKPEAISFASPLMSSAQGEGELKYVEKKLSWLKYGFLKGNAEIDDNLESSAMILGKDRPDHSCSICPGTVECCASESIAIDAESSKAVSPGISVAVTTRRLGTIVESSRSVLILRAGDVSAGDSQPSLCFLLHETVSVVGMTNLSLFTLNQGVD